MAWSEPSDPSMGKFDLLATYTMAQKLAEGVDQAEANHMGRAAAIMDAQIRKGLYVSAEYRAGEGSFPS